MDGKHFDEFTRKLATGASRRSVLRGLVGGAAALGGLKATDTLAAKEEKITICHATSSLSNPWVQITVSKNSEWPAHQSHGDFIVGGLVTCCRDQDCKQPDNPCQEKVCNITGTGTGRQSTCVLQNKPKGTTCPSDGNQCTDDICDGGTCTHPNKPKDTPCDDGQLCTENDVCNGNGVCAGTSKTCNDGNVCTDDSCDPATGNCINTFDCTNDASCCTGCQTCDSTTKQCVDDSTKCTDTGIDECLVGTCTAGACTYAPNNELCVDSDICTDAVCSAEGVCSFPIDCTNDTSCCTGCQTCNPTTKQCEDNSSLCTATNDCGTNGVCSGGTCTYTDDDSLCSGCQSCEATYCVDDSSLCPDTGCGIDGVCDAGTCTYTDDNNLCSDCELCTNTVCVADPDCGKVCTSKSECNPQQCCCAVKGQPNGTCVAEQGCHNQGGSEHVCLA